MLMKKIMSSGIWHRVDLYIITDASKKLATHQGTQFVLGNREGWGTSLFRHVWEEVNFQVRNPGCLKFIVQWRILRNIKK